jgi:hypothetical protein
MGMVQRRHPKEEDTTRLPPLSPTKKRWWEMQAEAALRGCDDPEEFPGQYYHAGPAADGGVIR